MVDFVSTTGLPCDPCVSKELTDPDPSDNQTDSILNYHGDPTTQKLESCRFVMDVTCVAQMSHSS